MSLPRPTTAPAEPPAPGQGLDQTLSLGRTSLPHLPSLDGWRGIAILLVLEGHFLKLLPFKTGRAGVDIFFVLSGFLMSGMLFIQRQPLGIFYRRRISRILPAFLTFVLLIYAYAAAAGVPFQAQELGATLAFLRTYVPAEPGIWKSPVPIGHLWSLNIEEHCYLFMSLWVSFRASASQVGRSLVLAGIACLLTTYAYVRWGPPRWGDIGTEVAAAPLLLAAGYRLLCARVQPRVPAWLPVITLAAALFCYANAAPWWASDFAAPFLLAFTINHLGEAASTLRAGLSTPWLCQIGLLSFSIYLWQQPFYVWQQQVWGGTPTALALALGTAVLSYRCVEKPSRRWLNQRW